VLGLNWFIMQCVYIFVQRTCEHHSVLVVLFVSMCNRSANVAVESSQTETYEIMTLLLHSK